MITERELAQRHLQEELVASSRLECHEHEARALMRYEAFTRSVVQFCVAHLRPREHADAPGGGVPRPPPCKLGWCA